MDISLLVVAVFLLWVAYKFVVRKKLELWEILLVLLAVVLFALVWAVRLGL